ncbi:MAG: ABC transporter substrate-binding protein [Bryobacteraceae bacterium]
MIAILLVLLVACLGCSRPAAEVRLGIAAQQSPSQMLTYLARDLGMFQAEGLTVTVEEFPGSSKALEALVGGSLDVVSGYHEQTLQLPEGSPRLRSFVAMTNGLLVALVASPGSKARVVAVQDLKGKTVGVTSLGSATHLFLNFVLAREGLAREGIEAGSVQPVAIGTAGRALAAMERGAVDAGVVSDFTVRHLEKRFGKVTILADTRTAEQAARTYGVAQYPGAAIYARADWIARHGEEVRKLVRAIGKTRAWVMSHSADEVAARMPASHKGDDAGLYRDVIAATMAMLTPDGRFTAEGTEAAGRVVGSKQSAKESYTNEYIESR